MIELTGLECLVAALTLWNIAVFMLYGADKRRARRGLRRISERTLLMAAALLGAPGALFGMAVFRHKTRHLKFRIGVPLLLLADVAIAIRIIACTA